MSKEMSPASVSAPLEPFFPRERVAIFWDYESCAPPPTTPGYVIADNIRRVAHNFGSVTLFKAYLELTENASQKTLKQRAELQSAGISLTDCPHNGKKDVSDKMIIVDLLAFAIDNPSPATIILISGDRDFVYAISVLRHRRYRVVLIVPKYNTHIALKSQANSVLEWQYDILQMPPPHFSAGASGGNSLPNSDSSNGTFFTARESLSENDPAAPGPSFQTSTLYDSGDIATPLASNPPSNNPIGNHLGFSQSPPLKQDPIGHLNGISAFADIPATPTSLGFSSPPNPPNSPPKHSPPTMFRGMHSRLSSLSGSSDSPPIGQSFNRARSQSLAIEPIRSIWRNSSDTIPVSPPQTGVNGRITTPSSLLYPTPASGPAMQSPWAFPQPSVLRPAPERPISTTTSSALPPRTALNGHIHTNGTSGLNPHPNGVPPHTFDLLIELLEKWRLQGNPQPLRSLVGAELPKRNPMLYQRAGVNTFGEYVRLAEKEGVIKLGAGNYPGSEWIALEPKYMTRSAVNSISNIVAAGADD